MYLGHLPPQIPELEDRHPPRPELDLSSFPKQQEKLMSLAASAYWAQVSGFRR